MNLRISIITFALVISIVSCSIFPSGTPDAMQALTSSRSVVEVNIDGVKHVINLASEFEDNIEGIEINVIDLGNYLLIETTDPQHRFLPTSQIISKDTIASNEITSLQFNVDIEWLVRPIGEIDDVDLLKEELLGKTSLRNLNDFLDDYEYPNGVTILFPVSISTDGNQQVNVYKTPAPNTVIITTDEMAIGSYKLAAPKRGAAIALVAVYMISLSIPIIVAITSGQDATVPDLLGEEWDLYQIREVAGAKYKKTKIYFKYNTVYTTCGSDEELGRVVKQEPIPGVKINAMEEDITLHICNEVVLAEDTDHAVVETEEVSQSEVGQQFDFQAIVGFYASYIPVGECKRHRAEWDNQTFMHGESCVGFQYEWIGMDENGILSLLGTWDYSDVGRLIQNEIKIDTNIHTSGLPYSPFLFDLSGAAFERFPANYSESEDRVIERSAFDKNVIGNSVLEVFGNEIDTWIVGYEYDYSAKDLIQNVEYTFTKNSLEYYDKVTGLLIKVEIVENVISCTPECNEIEDGVFIFELMDTNLYK